MLLGFGNVQVIADLAKSALGSDEGRNPITLSWQGKWEVKGWREFIPIRLKGMNTKWGASIRGPLLLKKKKKIHRQQIYVRC